MMEGAQWVLVHLFDTSNSNENIDVLMPKRIYKPEMGKIIQSFTKDDEKVKSHWNVLLKS